MIILVGFVLRLVYFFQVKDVFLFRRPFLDAGFYHRWALEIAGGDWAGVKRGVFSMSPGYSYFLAVIYSLFGGDIKTAIFIQLLLGVACGWMIYLLGKKLISREAGVLGAALFLLYAPEILYESMLLKAGLINVVNTGALLAAAAAANPAGWLLTGFLAGFSAHLRPTELLLIPVFVLWFWRRSPRKALAVLLFSGGLLLALLPVALRNYLVGGEWVWTTSHGGMNLYTGNSPQSRGLYEALPFARPDPAFEQDDFLQEARRRSGRDLTPAQSSRYWYAETWRFIRQEPLREAGLLLKKAIIFFNGYEDPINMDFYLFRKEFGSVLALPLVTFTILMPLAVLGMAQSVPNLLLLGYLIVIFLANVIFFVSAEYRVPAVPVLCIYAGWGVHRAVRDIRERSAKRLILSGTAFLFLVVFVSFDIYTNLLGVPDHKKHVAAKALFNLGLEYQLAGKDDKAIAAYSESIKLHPEDLDTHNNIGVVLARGGRLIEAIVHFKEAAPASRDAASNLRRALLASGRQREAEELLRQAPRAQAPRTADK